MVEIYLEFKTEGDNIKFNLHICAILSFLLIVVLIGSVSAADDAGDVVGVDKDINGTAISADSMNNKIILTVFDTIEKIV